MQITLMSLSVTRKILTYTGHDFSTLGRASFECSFALSWTAMETVSILVDVQNVYYTTKSAYGRNFDYRKFFVIASQGRTVVNAVAYAIDRGDEKQRNFQNILKTIGFEVKLKPFIQRSDGSAKGDWDVGIALDAMDFAEQSDRIVLVSGDGDFDLLANRIRTNHNSVVEVYGVEKLTAASLVRAASFFIPIEHSLLMD
ncbi:MAG: NYN domain-containing protein [Burkholderiaceae bacterium]